MSRIDLRNRIWLVAGVLLVLAVGIALGGGPLTGNHRAASVQSASADAEPSDVPTAYADEFAEAAATRLYADGLSGHATAVLAMPGADQDTVKALATQVEAAGGALTGTFQIGEALSGSSATLDQAGASLAAQLADPRINPAAGTYELLGQLLGVALATTGTTSARADPTTYAVRDGLAAAGLLTSPQDVRTAPLVLVVLAPGVDAPVDSSRTENLLSGLVAGLAPTALGVVVVGDTASATGGELAALRDTAPTGAVATVDGVETPLGQMTAVLAETQVLTGSGGSYGASGADGPLPIP